MAFENLLVRKEREINGIKIDAVISEQTSESVRATTNPVEFGAEVTDHIIRQPRTLVIEGVITDSPLGVAAITEAIGGAVDTVSGLIGSSEERGLTRSQEIYAELVTMLEDRELVSLSTGLKKYDNLIIQSLDVNQDKDTSRAVFFTATFVEVIIVFGAQSGVGEITDNDQSAAYSTQSNGGTVGTQETTPAGRDALL